MDPRHEPMREEARKERERYIEAFKRWSRDHSDLDTEVIDWAIGRDYDPDEPLHVGVVRIYADGYAAGLVEGHSEAMNGHECE